MGRSKVSAVQRPPTGRSDDVWVCGLVPTVRLERMKAKESWNAAESLVAELVARKEARLKGGLRTKAQDFA